MSSNLIAPTECPPVSIALRLTTVAAGMGAAFAAASLGLGALHAIGEYAKGRPFSVSSLLQAPLDTGDIAGLAVLFAVLVLELVRNGWRQSALRRILRKNDPSTRADLFYFILSATGLIKVTATVATLGIGDALAAIMDASTGIKAFATWPLYFAVPAVIVSQSFVQYWCHRALHAPLLWPLHAVHHAADDFNVITSFRHHPATGFFYAIILFVPSLLFSNEAVLIAMVFVNGQATYVHGDLPTSRFIERWLLVGPIGHGIHHGTAASCVNTNFSDLVIWDRLFGTYKAEMPQPLTYGCEDPEGVYQTGRPLRDMIAAQAAWIRSLGQMLKTRQQVAQPT